MRGDNRTRAVDWKELLTLLVVLGMFALLVVPKAWVCDDAYISFRVVDNLINGYGLRWNVGERVQTYTNPLWMLLHVPFYALSGNIYLTTISLSLICALGAVLLLLRLAPAFRWLAIGAVLLALFASRSFTDFMTSGLETPLTVLIFSAFLFMLWRRQFSWFFLTFFPALAFVNRMDSVLVMAPLCLLLAWNHRKTFRVRPALLGLLPALTWMLFSLLYYGFLFPNTKYSKLNTGLDLGFYLTQGLWYLRDLILRDTVTFTVIAGAWAYFFCIGVVALMRKIKGAPMGIGEYMPFALAAGIALQSMYVIYVGGDFMSGRFWVLPFFASAALLYLLLQTLPRLQYVRCGSLLIIVLTAVRLANDYHYPHLLPLTNFNHPDTHGIIVERMFYAPGTALFPVPGNWTIRLEPENIWIEWGKLAPHDPKHAGGVAITYVIGFYGFYAGPALHIIDYYGLADPLLARLPLPEYREKRIGHFHRDLPPGYEHARRTGDMSKMEPGLAQYYEKLRLVTSGELWSAERLRTIMDFQLGRYTAR